MAEAIADAWALPDAGASALARRVVHAADREDAAVAFAAAAALAQLTADRLQGARHRLRLPPGAPLAVRAGLRAVRVGQDRMARGAALVRGRLGLEQWHVTIRDLTNVLAEAVLVEDQEERSMVLAGFRGALAPLRGGVPAPPARWLADGRAEPSWCFTRLGLRPADCVALAGRFAQAHPDRDRVLLVVGLRPEGSYLAPLVAAALTALDYRHVVCRSVRADGPLLPEEPRLIESVRRIGGVALLCSGPPRTGAAIGRVAARLVTSGFAPDRVVPVYPSLARSDAAPVPGPLRPFPAVVLSAEEWHAHRAPTAGTGPTAALTGEPG
ncbi:hypothetical protein [Streptacidiphilus melanogenes]|uniref:hypothetical protein n=1 Tax=Streptacidiphilus melanogenes TaxID=411235 RepID=UPI0005A9F4EA|nr:hypothetical protein [Streptacidiphilus melanogenes]